MFQKESKTTRLLLPVSFFGVLVSLLMFSESMHQTTATTIITNTPTLEVQQIPAPEKPYPTCDEDDDCPLPTTYCSNGKCRDLDNPICDCGQPQVLRCYEASGKARFLYCPSECSNTPDGTICE